MGEKGVTFADADIYSELYVASVKQETIDQKSAALIAFLEGLEQAARFTEENPEDAKAILIEYTRLEKHIVDAIWPNFVFKPALTPQFLEYTEAQARWAVDRGTFPADTAIPDFRSIVYPDLLRAVNPVSAANE